MYSPTPDALQKDCHNYLQARTGQYELRCDRYFGAWQKLREMNLSSQDTVLDLGAGWTEFGHFMSGIGWRGRYWPVDAALDGTSVMKFVPFGGSVEYIAALELVEHFHRIDADGLLIAMKLWATKGVVVTTPNPRTTDVIAMDPDHRTAYTKRDLEKLGYNVEERSFYGQPNDSLLAWYKP